MRLGADVEDLDRLAVMLQRGASELRTLRTELSGAVSGVVWQGPDARRFAEVWRHRHDRQIERAAAELVRAATAVIANDRDQRAVSDGSDIGGAVAGIGPSTGSSMGPSIAPAPDRVRLLHVDIGGGEVVQADLGVSLRVEHLGGGLVRATEIDSVGIGPSAGAGPTAEVWWGDSSYGAQAQASINGAMAASGSRVWTIPEDQLPALITARSRDLLLGSAGGSTAAVLGSLPGAGSVAESVGLGKLWDAATAVSPTPTAIGMSVGTAGDLSALLGPTGASAELGLALVGSESVGVEIDTTTRALTATFAVAGAAAVGSRSGGATLDARLSFTPSGSPARLDLVERSIGVNSVDQKHSAIDLSHPEVSGAARELQRAVSAGGDINAATRRVVAAAGVHSSSASASYDVSRGGRYGIDLGIATGSVTYRDLSLVR